MVGKHFENEAAAQRKVLHSNAATYWGCEAGDTVGLGG